VWPYHRFPLSFHEVEELLPARGIQVSYQPGLSLPDAGSGVKMGWCGSSATSFCLGAG
jgi:hypothetical protein